jgi:hypothetical protein
MNRDGFGLSEKTPLLRAAAVVLRNGIACTCPLAPVLLVAGPAFGGPPANQ